MFDWWFFIFKNVLLWPDVPKMSLWLGSQKNDLNKLSCQKTFCFSWSQSNYFVSSTWHQNVFSLNHGNIFNKEYLNLSWNDSEQMMTDMCYTYSKQQIQLYLHEISSYWTISELFMCVYKEQNYMIFFQTNSSRCEAV